MRRTKQSRRRGAEAPGSAAKQQISSASRRRALAPADPFALFEKWFRDAEKAGEPLPEAMALATATRDGRPSVRIVLNRGVSRGGFVFYTNYNSRKAAELADNPRAAFVFHWPKLERQLRVEGRVQQTDAPRIGAVFSDAPAREPPQRMGIAAERDDSGTIVSRGGICARASALRRSKNSVSAVLGRLPHCRELYRVLAGTTASPARSRALSAKRKNLDDSPACTLEKPLQFP